MISSIYFILMMLAAGNLVYLAQKHFTYANRYLWTLIIIIPIIDLGYWLKSTVHSPEAALIALCFLYLFNTVAPVICLFMILNTIGIVVSRLVKGGVYGITTAHLLSIWLSKDSTLYYASLEVREGPLGSATLMTAGPLKYTHYVFLGMVMGVMLIALIHGFLKKEIGSKKTLKIYCGFLVLGLFLYGTEVWFKLDYSLLPILYTAASFVATALYEHYQCHELNTLIGNKQSRTGLRGFASFDLNRCLLDYNKQFANLIPEIEKVGIDKKISSDSQSENQNQSQNQSQNQGLIGLLYPAIDLFENLQIETQNIDLGERRYSITVSTFSVNEKGKPNGYLLEIADITEETRSREIIEKYNEVLSKEVSEKTEHIAEIQNTVVLGLANMIENRDDNTGGHVKRTSDVIKLLVEEIIRRKTYDIDEQKAADIIRSAPMHDLGKIAIDNSILCKPGKLTDEEYAIMKTHAPKSGEIVKIILEGVEEQHFVDVAFHVARYHHERWDGKGYPDRLLGENIPVEARIMAVADVYDALVSKRCYKEPMSFDKAFDIMNECMGSQFDPAMRPVFIACRAKLEEYYSKVNQ